MGEFILIAFYILILLYSVIIHEVSHGLVALWMGDMTAKYAGRLNLNPKNHIDPWGSIGVPALMLLISNFRFAFGWAKPVPYNPYNLRNQKWGPLIVALSGPGINILIALLAVGVAQLIPLRFDIKLNIIQNLNDWSAIVPVLSGSIPAIAFELLLFIIFWNVLLAFFNLIPIPPLDGSKILYAIFPISSKTQIFLEQFGFLILLFVIIFFSGPISIFLSTALNFFFGLTL